MAINESLFQWLLGFAHLHPLLDAAIVFFAKYFSYLLVLVAIGLLFAERNRRQRVFLLLEVLLTILLSRGLITEGIRFFYQTPRPFDTLALSPLINDPFPSTSFPSGHAALYFAIAAALFLHNRRWGMWFFALSLVNGTARVIAGVHWPIDILGGALIAIISAIIIHLLLARTAKALRIEATPALPSRDAAPAEPGADAA